MACRVEKFSSLCLFACFYFQTCETCVCHYVGLRCVWMSVSVNRLGHRVNLQGKPHHLSTPGMSLSPWLHAPVLPLFLCPACLSQRCTPACLKLPHSPGALSSVGGNTLSYYFQTLSYDTLDGQTDHFFRKTASTYMLYRTHSKHCSKPCWLFPQVHFMCHA